MKKALFRATLVYTKNGCVKWRWVVCRVLVFVLLLSSFLFGGDCRYVLQENKSEVYTDKGIVTFGDVPLYGSVGEPQLPVDNITLLLPPQADMKTVEVFLEDVSFKEHVGFYSVSPVEPLRTTSQVREYYGIFEKGRMYQENALFPQSLIRLVQKGELRKRKLLDVTVQRFQINPVTGVLREVVGGELVVRYKEHEIRQSFSALPATMENTLGAVVDNYSRARLAYNGATHRAKATYLIMTTKSFLQESLALDTFVAIKENQGFNVEIATEDTWGGGTGDAAMTKIRSWLKANYESKNIEYLFIIGDPSQSSKLPMTHGPTNSDTNPLVDYCYADLSSARLNSEEESGENRLLDFDKYAEINVGRLPVYNGDVATADKLLRKFISYATETSASAESWRFNVLMPMANFSDAQNGVVFGEAITKKILKPAGWGQFRVYKDHMGIPAEGYPLSYTNTRDYWNAGKFGVMIWQGHGLPTKTFSGPMEYVMDSPTASGITSEYPSHSFQVSCHNGCPFNPSNLGYALLKTGAISTIASAVEIWYSAMNTNYGTQGNGNDFGYIYVKTLVEDSLPAAAAFNKTRAFLPINGVQAWQNLTELNLYGCPATGVYTYGISGDVSIKKKLQKVQSNFAFSHTKRGVRFLMPSETKGTLSIINLQGRLVDRVAFNGESCNWDYKKNAFASGVYFAQLYTNTGSIERVRFTIQ